MGENYTTIDFDKLDKANERLALLNKVLIKNHEKWRAGITSNWDLSNDDLVRRLGVNPNFESEDITPQATSNQTPNWMNGRYMTRDWRGYYKFINQSTGVSVQTRTQDYTTSIKDQHVCPSCSAFAIAASMESNFQIQLENELHRAFPYVPNLKVRDALKLMGVVGDEIDLSEWYVYVNGFSHSGTLCSSDQGTWPTPMEGIRNISTIDGIAVPWEFMMRYPWPDVVWYANLDPHLEPLDPSLINAIDYTQYLGPDSLYAHRELRDKLELKIVGDPPGLLGGFIIDESVIFEWLSNVGPVVTIMTIWGDFARAYSGGIYKHHTWTPVEIPDDVAHTRDQMNSKIGNHAVCIVGYSEEDRCWICKNSWGPRWGDAGWFYIDFDDLASGIGTSASQFYATVITEDCIQRFIEGVRLALPGIAEIDGIKLSEILKDK